MIGLPDSLSLTHIRWLLIASDALAVPAALLLSLRLYANGAVGFAISWAYLAVVMCVAAVLSHQLGKVSVLSGPRSATSTAFACILSSLVTLALPVVLASTAVPFTMALPVIFGMSFFVIASVFRTTLSFAMRWIPTQCPSIDLGFANMTPHCPVQSPTRLALLETIPEMNAEDTWPEFDASRLLGREEVETCQGEEAKAYADRVVLVSGAGGSIGSELVQQVLACRPRKILLYELNESALYQIHQSMLLAASGTDTEIVPLLGSVGEEQKVRRTLRKHQVQVILHAAAYKHVPLVELNPLSGLSNNVLATQTLVTEAVAAGVERFVLISSDKAVRPINVMGASKRLCELIVQDVARRCTGERFPIFAIVRFGNVLGSSGSVLPLFQGQVRRGGPVTVTHPEVSRFFMTVKEAVHLVLHAGSLARGGEVFVLDMGKPIQIEALARQVIHSAGLSVRDEDNPTGDIEIDFIGLRCGEKMSEELTLSGKRSVTRHPRIFKAIEEELSEFEVAAALRALRHALANDDEVDARLNACRWVEGFGAVSDGLTSAPTGPSQRRVGTRLSAKARRSKRIEVGHR